MKININNVKINAAGTALRKFNMMSIEILWSRNEARETDDVDKVFCIWTALYLANRPIKNSEELGSGELYTYIQIKSAYFLRILKVDLLLGATVGIKLK